MSTPSSGEGGLLVQAPMRPLWRYHLARALARAATWLYARVTIEGGDRLPAGPAVLCFNHANWTDPVFVFGWLPGPPRLYLYGPEQQDMRRGFRNSLMRWSGVVIPFRPGRRGLLASTRRTQALLASGARVGFAGEGRIHAGEAELLPLLDGPAYYALLAGVPVVPVAINGTTWLRFRGRVRLRAGLPIEPLGSRPGSPSRTAVADLTARIWASLHELVADCPEQPRPGPLGRWLTELFNDWPEGSRPVVGSRAEALPGAAPDEPREATR
jgi:1-acyl-sn-glycerol-3-phosphate acyltransferase